MKKALVFSGAASAALLLAWAVAALNGCASARQRAAEREAQAAAERRGRAIFLNNCDRCHPGGDKMIGPSLKHWYVMPFIIRRQVRHGGSGMPAFSNKDIDDAQLADLVAYIASLRRPSAGCARWGVFFDELQGLGEGHVFGRRQKRFAAREHHRLLDGHEAPAQRTTGMIHRELLFIEVAHLHDR